MVFETGGISISKIEEGKAERLCQEPRGRMKTGTANENNSSQEGMTKSSRGRKKPTT